MLLDPATFSSAVSTHLAVPSGIDPPDHADYRRIVEKYFSSERMTAVEPAIRAIAVEILSGFPEKGEVDFMMQVAESFALQAQCAFLGWPADLHEPLRHWMRRNRSATRRNDRKAMAAVAFEFDRHIREILHRRNDGNETDVASQLAREQFRDRPLTHEEIVSILRNWTVGELATIASCVGILAHFLAGALPLQSQLRSNPAELPAAIDEILRIHAPLLSSRRVTTTPVVVDGCPVQAGERITLDWASANRDERVFDQPREFRLDRNPRMNLLYGAGIHVCPGAPLARLELRVLLEELLARFELAPSTRRQPTEALHPASGFASCPLEVRKR
ncbi:MAG TPA: cytochrome P450 [Steroidobacteraceae bacterium]|nr:cytochrome P450 [Steroidobacteraceae bacterium]